MKGFDQLYKNKGHLSISELLFLIQINIYAPSFLIDEIFLKEFSSDNLDANSL